MPKNAALGLLAAILLATGWFSAGWIYWSPRVEAAKLAQETAERSAAFQKSSAETCAKASETQNAAIANLKGRLAASEVDALQVRLQALAAASVYEQRAQAIQAETVAPGADQCLAASDAFDAELARERAQ